MVEKPEYRGLVQPVRGISEAEQKAILAPFEPTEIYVCRKPEDFDAYLKQMRPPRVALVSHIGLLGEQRGSKQDRVDHMVAMKAGVHRRGCIAIEGSTKRRTDKAWKPLKADGAEMARRLAQGAKSALNGLRGTPAHASKLSDSDLRDLMRVRESTKYKNWRQRRAAIVRLGIKPVPGRTWFIEKLENIARARGLLD